MYGNFSEGWNHVVQLERSTNHTRNRAGCQLILGYQTSLPWAISYHNQVVSIDHYGMLQKMPYSLM